MAACPDSRCQQEVPARLTISSQNQGSNPQRDSKGVQGEPLCTSGFELTSCKVIFQQGKVGAIPSHVVLPCTQSRTGNCALAWLLLCTPDLIHCCEAAMHHAASRSQLA